MNRELKPLPPFKGWVLENFPFIEADFDAITNYQLISKVIEYLNNIIANENEQNSAIIDLTNKFIELKNYVDNLDLQEYVDDKLDEMAESGQLADIIAQYLGLAGMITFNSVAEMKLAENLVNGSKCCTLGYNSANDGGRALYRIRTVTNEDVEDDMLIIALHNVTLVAELIYNDEINVLQVGLDPTNTNDNSTKLQSLINKVNNLTLFFPTGTYKFTEEINLNNKAINLKGNFNHAYGLTDLGLIFDNSNGFINTERIFIEQLIIQQKELARTTIGINIKSGTRIKECTIIGFDYAIKCNYAPIVAEDCNIHYNNYGISNCVDSRIINNTINANEKCGIELQAGANDNIIDSNKIEWNKIYHILMYQCTNMIISNNVFDRSTQQALRMGQVTKTTITGNLFRRNNISTTTVNDSCQVRMESCNNIIFSSNELAKGNSLDDGTGDTVPQYAMYILTSHDILSIGNSYIDSSVQTDHIKQYNNSTNIQFFDLAFNIPTLLTGSDYTGSVTTESSLTLSVPGTPSVSNGYPKINRYNYYIRKTDQGAYESGELVLSNFKLWNSETATSAKMSISSFVSGNITSTITFDRETNKYNIVFTSTSGNYNVRLEQIYI